MMMKTSGTSMCALARLLQGKLSNLPSAFPALHMEYVGESESAPLTDV